MATIGTFTRDKTGTRDKAGYTGAIRTLTVDIKARFVANDARKSKSAPDFRIFSGQAELGAAWKARSSGETPRGYLSVVLDDPSFAAPILDELPTLHQVPSLQPGLAESRQFGGCFVLGVQVASALRDLYGRNGAETISGLCGTRVVLAAPDRDTAQWSADSLGRSEIEEVAEGVSYGANTIRDGVSLTPRRELRSLALPSEIMRLENLHGYLKFPGPWPVASIKLDYVKRPKKADRYVPRAPSSDQDSRQSGKTATEERNGVESDATVPMPADAGGGVIDMLGDQWELDLAPARDAGVIHAPATGEAEGEASNTDEPIASPPPSEGKRSKPGDGAGESGDAPVHVDRYRV